MILHPSGTIRDIREHLRLSGMLLRKVTSPGVSVFDPPVQVTKTVGLFTKPVPLIVIVCTLLDPLISATRDRDVHTARLGGRARRSKPGGLSARRSYDKPASPRFENHFPRRVTFGSFHT